MGLDSKENVEELKIEEKANSDEIFISSTNGNSGINSKVDGIKEEEKKKRSRCKKCCQPFCVSFFQYLFS